jgi:hypothetical protein
METNWQLLEFNQEMMNSAIEEFTEVDPEWCKFQELAEWINQQPYPYQPKIKPR